MDEVSEHGEGDYLMRLAHVQKMAEYVANLVAQGADSEAGVLCLLRIGANDPKTGLPLERVHEQLKVSDDGHRLERVSAQSDSAAMAVCYREVGGGRGGVLASAPNNGLSLSPFFPLSLFFLTCAKSLSMPSSWPAFLPAEKSAVA